MIRKTATGWELYQDGRLIASSQCLETINAARRLLAAEVAPAIDSEIKSVRPSAAFFAHPPFTPSKVYKD